MTKLARFFDTTRFDRRALETGKLGILSLPGGILRLVPQPALSAALAALSNNGVHSLAFRTQKQCTEDELWVD
jgi:hypothetical protein